LRILSRCNIANIPNPTYRMDDSFSHLNRGEQYEQNNLLWT